MEHLNQFETADELRVRVDQLELLLREADHRIANSLQLASSLAGHEAGAIRDPIARARLLATQRYIEAIAGVHQLLIVGRAGEPLPLHDYLRRLVTRLQAGMANGGVDRRISLRADCVDSDADIAVWIGMIVIELVANACKYAYRETEPGEIRVALTARTGGFVLEVEDDGPGVDDARPPTGSGLGARMISAMARRMGAEFRYERGAPGARAVLLATGPAFSGPGAPPAFAPPASESTAAR